MFNCNYLNTIWIFLCDHCLVLFCFVFISININIFREFFFFCFWLFSDVQFIVVQIFSIFPHTETASIPSYSSSSASFLLFLLRWYSVLLDVLKNFLIFFSFLYTEFLDNECHVFFAWQTHFFPLPKWIMNGKGINCNRQMFCMDLWKAFTTGIVSAIEIEWNIVDLEYLKIFEMEFQWNQLTCKTYRTWIHLLDLVQCHKVSIQIHFPANNCTTLWTDNRHHEIVLGNVLHHYDWFYQGLFA